MASQKKPTAKQKIEHLQKELDFERSRCRIVSPISIDEFNWLCETLESIKEKMLNPPTKIDEDN